MRLHKSSKARDVLMSQNLALSQAERRVLILCDGQRTRATVEKMLGDAASSTIDVLIAQGYLQASSPVMSDAASGNTPALPAAPVVATTASPDARPASAQSRHHEAASPTLRPGLQAHRESRRSLAACKMYMLDMLQLQRSLESSSLSVDIQTAGDEDRLVDSLLQALRHLGASTKATMAERIAQRLQETMPEAYLPALEDEIRSLFERTPASSAGVHNVIAMRRDVA